MEQLLDGHSSAGVFAIPREIIGDFALQRDFIFADLLKDEQGSELLSDGGDAEFCARSVGNIVLEAGFTHPLRVNDLAVVRDENGAVEVAVLLVLRNKPVDPLGLAGRGSLTGGEHGCRQKKACEEGSALAGHAGEDTGSSAKIANFGRAWRRVLGRKKRDKS